MVAIVWIIVLVIITYHCFVIASDNASRDFHVEFQVKVRKAETSSFIVHARADWAPIGAERFRTLVESGFFDGGRFFRVIPKFVAQFGINGDPAITALWENNTIPDDKRKFLSNERLRLSFNTMGPGTRCTQLFINLDDNDHLDGEGYHPFAVVVSGMDVVEKLMPTGEEGRGDGRDRLGPSQERMHAEGNKYLKKVFPNLSYIISAKVIDPVLITTEAKVQAGSDEL